MLTKTGAPASRAATRRMRETASQAEAKSDMRRKRPWTGRQRLPPQGRYLTAARMPEGIRRPPGAKASPIRGNHQALPGNNRSPGSKPAKRATGACQNRRR